MVHALRGVMLDVAALDARVIVQPAPRRDEHIRQGEIDVRMALLVRHHDLVARDGDDELDLESIAMTVVVMR